ALLSCLLEAQALQECYHPPRGDSRNPGHWLLTLPLVTNLELMYANESHRYRFFVFQTERNHFTDSWIKLLERLCLRVAALERRHGGDEKAILVLFDQHGKRSIVCFVFSCGFSNL